MGLPHYALDKSVHDRMAPRRDDETFISAVLASPDTRFLLIEGDAVAVDPRSGRLVTLDATQVRPAIADESAGCLRLMLGALDGVPHVAIVADQEAKVAGLAALADAEMRPLRRALNAFSGAEGSLAVQAVALAQWHARHPRCSVCGEPSAIEQGGSSRRCPQCGAQHFPRTDPAVIVLVEDGQGRCLLAHNAARDDLSFSTLAGFVDPGETLEDAVAREVFEETGVRVKGLEYRGSQPWPFPASLMLGFHAYAASTDIHVDGVEIARARWFTRDDLAREVASGEVVVSTTVSISGALIQDWFGGPLARPQAATR